VTPALLTQGKKETAQSQPSPSEPGAGFCEKKCIAEPKNNSFFGWLSHSDGTSAPGGSGP